MHSMKMISTVYCEIVMTGVY